MTNRTHPCFSVRPCSTWSLSNGVGILAQGAGGPNDVFHILHAGAKRHPGDKKPAISCPPPFAYFPSPSPFGCASPSISNSICMRLHLHEAADPENWPLVYSIICRPQHISYGQYEGCVRVYFSIIRTVPATKVFVFLLPLSKADDHALAVTSRLTATSNRLRSNTSNHRLREAGGYAPGHRLASTLFVKRQP